MTNGWLTGWKAIAAYLGVSESTAQRLWKYNNLPVLEINKTKVCVPDLVDKWQKEKHKWNNCVYFIGCQTTKQVKIGFSANVTKRFNALKSQSPVPLELLITIPGTKKDEKKLHKRFRKYRTHGEWFEPNKRIMRYLEKLRKRLQDGVI